MISPWFAIIIQFAAIFHTPLIHPSFTSTHLKAMLLNIPLFISFEAGHGNSRNLDATTRLPQKPSTKGNPWDQLYSQAIEEPVSLEKWERLVSFLEENVNAAINRNESTVSLKSSIVDLFSALLSVFPYLTNYWRRYALLMKKLDGISEYTKVLKSSVAANPQSVVLWTEYCQALVEVQQSSMKLKQANDKEFNEKDQTEDSNGTDLAISDSSKSSEMSKNDIRQEFERGAALIGYNFNSDTFWDAYIDFELRISKNSQELLSLYLFLVTIPLYSYAHFYNKFIEASKGYRIEDIIKDEKFLASHAETYGKSLVDELSADESQQILDTFTYEIFTQTQRKVNEKWTFESEILIHDYSPSATPALTAQLASFIKYIDYELGVFENMDKGAKEQQKNIIVSIFERALVPHCHETSLWRKYVTFLVKIGSSSEEIQKVYESAIFKFVPLNDSEIRKECIYYLVEQKEVDVATSFLLKSLKFVAGPAEKLLYIKPSYLHDLTLLMKIWSENMEYADLEQTLEGLVSGFFDRVDRYKKPSTQPKATSELSYNLEAKHVNALSKLLNNDGICVVAVSYLRLLGQEEDPSKIRKFYNKHHKEIAFSRSVQFWNFFVQFEGYRYKNFVNLRNVLKFIKESSALPKKAVDAFVEIQYELTCANLLKIAYFSDTESLMPPLVNIGIDTSDDIFVNSAARKRLIKNNVPLQENKGLSQPAKETQVIQGLKSHLSHPGIYADNSPEISNSWINKGWISLREEKTPLFPPPPPTFRFLDRANAPLTHDS